MAIWNSAVPVAIVTGFLGSGKTALVNGMLRSGELNGVGIIVNELGSLGIDHELIETQPE